MTPWTNGEVSRSYTALLDIVRRYTHRELDCNWCSYTDGVYRSVRNAADMIAKSKSCNDRNLQPELFSSTKTSNFSTSLKLLLFWVLLLAVSSLKKYKENNVRDRNLLDVCILTASSNPSSKKRISNNNIFDLYYNCLWMQCCHHIYGDRMENYTRGRTTDGKLLKK